MTVKELKELKKKINNPEFVKVIDKKIAKLEDNKTIHKDGY